MSSTLERKGREAVPDRETIESVLQRVQSGELSPAEATKLLLAEDQRGLSTSDTQYESLASLVNRLGTPPTDIVETWCQQLREIASQHHDQTGETLPAIDLHRWSITPAGHLVWQGRSLGTSSLMIGRSGTFQGTHPARSHSPEPRAGFDDQIDEFRTKLAPSAPRRSDALLPRAAMVAHGDRTTEIKPQTRHRALFLAVVLVCVTIAGSILYNNLSQIDVEPIANIDAPARFATADRSIANAPTSDPIAPGLPESAENLETLETIKAVEPSPLATATVETETSFSLEQLMPPAAHFIPKPDQNDSTRTSGRGDDGPLATDASDVLEQALGDDPSPAESPQQTRASTVMAVQLRDVDDSVEPTKLPEINLTELKLDFPFDLPLGISGDELSWQIRDLRTDTSVAEITRGPRGIGLKWSESAQASPSAASLVHGRITDRDGDTIFLRPSIEANPWPILLDKPDVMPVWNLRYPIPPRAARISVDFAVPDEIEMGWIEPIESASLRRTRGLAVLTPKDGETVSLGVRFDIRCNRKLTCRVRYAGRLDPSMPWQVVSISMLERFANQLAEQVILVNTEASRLAAVYEIAGTSGKQILRVKRGRNDALGATIRTASQRVAELQRLIALLKEEGSLKIRIWVEWPGAQQTLLTMQQVDPQQDEVEAPQRNGANR